MPSELGKQVVRPLGLEPRTAGLEVRCSIQLGYGRSSQIGTECIIIPVRATNSNVNRCVWVNCFVALHTRGESRFKCTANRAAESCETGRAIV